MEELAKAKWLYETAEWQWNRPLGLYLQPPEPAGPVAVPEQLRTTRRPHTEKLQTAERFASGLGGFWDPTRRSEYYFPEDLNTFEETAKQRNKDKQAGFYVDREDGVVLSPLSINGDEVRALVQHAAEVLEMHLIEDHTRQQGCRDSSKVDSSQDLHWQVIPIAHPEEFADFIGSAEDESAG